MEKEQKEMAEELVEEVAQTHFPYGDLVKICRKCGHIQTLDKQIKSGIQITLLTNTQSFLHLECEKCDSGMELRFSECEAPIEEEVEDNTEHEVTAEDVVENPGEDLEEGEVIEIPSDSIIEETDEIVHQENDEAESV